MHTALALTFPAHVNSRTPLARQAVSLALAVVEAFTGRRPLHHLRNRLSIEAFQHLSDLRDSGRFTASQVGSWRCQMPHPGAAEIVIRISLATRWLVCVMRFDFIREWRCSSFRILEA